MRIIYSIFINRKILKFKDLANICTLPKHFENIHYTSIRHKKLALFIQQILHTRELTKATNGVNLNDSVIHKP